MGFYGGGGRNFAGDDPGQDLVPMGQAQVLSGRYVTQHGRSRHADGGNALAEVMGS